MLIQIRIQMPKVSSRCDLFLLWECKIAGAGAAVVLVIIIVTVSINAWKGWVSDHRGIIS